MTDLLKSAFDEASALPDAEQDQLARWLIEELRSEQRWQKAFSESSGELEKLATEALDEYRQGLTEPLDPENL